MTSTEVLAEAARLREETNNNHFLTMDSKSKSKKHLPNVDKVTMIINYSDNSPRKELVKKNEASLSHVLYPSRSPPPKKKSSRKEKAKSPSLALTIDSFAAARITSVSNTPQPRPNRQTLHRRNKPVFASSYSPTKSSSLPFYYASSPSKVRSGTKAMHLRKHHRRHNLALTAMDYDNLFTKLKVY